MTYTTRTPFRLCALALAGTLLVAACGDDSTSDDGGDPASTETPTGTESPAGTSAGDDTASTTGAAGTDPVATTAATNPSGSEAVDLSAACPSPLVVQLDWHPQSEYGALFNLLGDDYSIDTGNQRITAPLETPAGPTGIDLEIRAGGPAIGFAPPRTQIYTDDSIHLAQSNIDAQIPQWDDAPLIAVAGPLDKNPQILMWDAETYPEIDTIEDLGEAGVTVNTFGTGGYIEVFIAQGLLTEDQVDPAYDGTPSRFISARDIAQQGFASAEPFKYEFEFDEYGKAPKYQLLHDAGFETYSQTLSLPPDTLEEMRPCLELLVPIVQQSVVDFASDPDDTIAKIVDMVETVDTGWTQSVELGNYAVETMTELGLHGNGSDDVVGNFDVDRVDALLQQIRDAGIDVNADLTVDDLVTNEFIDPSIGF